MKFRFIILLSWIFVVGCQSDNRSAGTKLDDTWQSSYLITNEALHRLLNRPDTVASPYKIIQVSPEQVYANEHIKNALQLWRPDYADNDEPLIPGMKASKEKVESLLQDLGYQDHMTLILYDHKGNVDALRFAWVLQFYGFTNFKILNGGLANWKAEGYSTTREMPAEPMESKYTIRTASDMSLLADHGDVLHALQDSNVLLIDTREDYEYLGQPFIHKNKVCKQKKGALNYGSIPTSIHLNWSRFADLKTDKKFKSRTDIEYDLAQRGVTKDKEIILYCQSGSRTCHTFFVLTELLGYPNVRNYDGSWLEWTYLNSRNPDEYPIEQITSNEEFNRLYNECEKKLKS